MNVSLAHHRPRRQFLQTLASAATLSPALTASAAVLPGQKVRDRLWIGAHDVHCYDHAWGLPGNSRMTPVEGAHYLGVSNIIMVRYQGKPAPPFEQYVIPFKSLARVDWSIIGANGETSDEERDHVLRLAASLPNFTGVFMDDFFQMVGDKPSPWLAANRPLFPVYLLPSLAEAQPITRLELAQSAWNTGDYRSGDFVVETAQGEDWRSVGRGQLANAGGAKSSVRLDGSPVRRVRIAILNTQDQGGGLSCGLSGVSLWAGDRKITLADAQLDATSSYSGHGPENLVGGDGGQPQAPASLSVEQLHAFRSQLELSDGRCLTLEVTLYTHQLSPKVRPHLDLCEVISLWTWESKDLQHLESNFERLRSLAPEESIRLGCYMWDSGIHKPIPTDRMKQQCEFALAQLRKGTIEGIVFLATNNCDLGLEVVEWIAQVGDRPIT